MLPSNGSRVNGFDSAAIAWQSVEMPALKKPDSQKKLDQVRIPLTAAEKRALGAAAKRDALPLATWLRSVGLRYAKGELVPKGA
jgi:hypothetical protein